MRPLRQVRLYSSRRQFSQQGTKVFCPDLSLSQADQLTYQPANNIYFHFTFALIEIASDLFSLPLRTLHSLLFLHTSAPFAHAAPQYSDKARFFTTSYNGALQSLACSVRGNTSSNSLHLPLAFFPFESCLFFSGHSS